MYGTTAGAGAGAGPSLPCLHTIPQLAAMKTAAVLACLASASSLVSAFVAPSAFSGSVARSTSQMKMSAADSLIGADVETKGIWDPLGFTKDGDENALYRRRCVELKHGRVAMLAVLGNIVAEAWHPLYDGKLPSGLAAISQVPAAGWLQIIAAIGVIEVSIGKQQEDKAPGEIGTFGQAFRPADDADFAALQLKELKNGRLAMIAIMAELVQNALTGMTPFEQIAAGKYSL